MKKCKVCLETKPLTDFRTYPKDGYYKKTCHECEKAIQRERYKKNKDMYKKNAYRWREKNYEKYLDYQKQYAKENPEIFKKYRLNNRDRIRAQWALNYAVMHGKLERPETCQICGIKEKKLQAHHNDYSKPLEVIFVCLKCHNDIHHRFTNHKLVACQ